MKKWVWNNFKKCRKEIFFSLLCIVLYTFSMVIAPISVRLIVSKINVDQTDIVYLVIGILILLGVYLLQTFINIIWNISLDKFGGKFIMELSDELQHIIISSDFSQIEKIGVNRIKSILYSDVFDCFRIFGNFIPTMISALVVLIFCTVYSFTINLSTTLIIICACLFGFLLTLVSRKRLNFVGKKTNYAMKEIYANDVDFCDNINEIKTNLLLNNEILKNEEKVNNFLKTAIKEDTRSFFWSGITTSYNAVISIGVSLYVAFYTKTDILQNVLLYTVLVALMISSIERIENSLYRIFKLKNSLDNISLVYSIELDKGDISIKTINEIIFKNLNYSFDEQKVLNDINISLKSGDIIKIDGPNGSGKSTIIKLLMKIYHAPKGSIYINSIDYRELAYNDYISKILYVGQDEKLHNATIKKYLKNVAKDFNEMELEEYATKFELDLNKEIIDNGMNLSVGQRKKILFLKCVFLYSKVDVIILDELFAGVDFETKRIMFDFINENLKDKIVLIINHEADEINYTNRISMNDFN